MPVGWIRAYDAEDSHVGTKIPNFQRQNRAEFRSTFSTALRRNRSETSAQLASLNWGDDVELPDGRGSGQWTKVQVGGKSGFIRSDHLVEVAYVGRKRGKSARNFRATLNYDRFDWDTLKTTPDEMELLWGDLVQVITRGPRRSEVRVRGVRGKMNTADLVSDGLLDVYFIDVGQGDGVLVSTPDRRHMLIDGGLTRSRQQTGKNAADLVDWKFFFDYGDFRMRLESMMASHSDTDHFGGLHDLVRLDELADRELDCLGVDVDTFHHPGLSRWTRVQNATPPHADGLGPKLNNGFVRLLDDRKDAEDATGAGGNGKLSGPWGRFVRAVLDNSAKTKVKRVMVARKSIQSGAPLPDLWKPSANCEIQVLAPVSYLEDGKVALPDLGAKSKNTNGHSICLRVKYGKARILLTGDLNANSMNWLEDCYDDRIALFKCDVVKGCHHGSDDISYRFLEAVNAGATVISSGDAEGHAHPRPEVVAASACSGFLEIDRDRDRMVTPLVYMTEIQRSVTLGAINRIDIKGMQVENQAVAGTILGRPVDEIDDMGFVSRDERRKLRGKTDSERKKAVRLARKEAKPALEAAEDDTRFGKIRIDFNLTVPLGAVDKQNVSKRGWRTHMMAKTHYGMVTVRTDGDVIMCATLNETAENWTIHTFNARF